MEPSTSTNEFPCTECGKKFRSWKALFGHMRCHPDRRHRGMLNYSRSRPDEEKSTAEDYEVADCLLMLANGAFASNFTHGVDDGGADQRPNATDKLLPIKEEPSAVAATYIKNDDDDRCNRHKCSSKCVRVLALGGHKRPCMHHHRCKHEAEEFNNLGFDLNSCPLLLNVQGNVDDSNYAGLDLELRL